MYTSIFAPVYFPFNIVYFFNSTTTTQKNKCKKWRDEVDGGGVIFDKMKMKRRNR